MGRSYGKLRRRVLARAWPTGDESISGRRLSALVKTEVKSGREDLVVQHSRFRSECGRAEERILVSDSGESGMHRAPRTLSGRHLS